MFPLMRGLGHEQIPSARLKAEARRAAAPQARVVQPCDGLEQARMRRDDAGHRGLGAHGAMQRDLRRIPGRPVESRVARRPVLVAVGGQVGHEAGQLAQPGGKVQQHVASTPVSLLAGPQQVRDGAALQDGEQVTPRGTQLIDGMDRGLHCSPPSHLWNALPGH